MVNRKITHKKGRRAKKTTVKKHDHRHGTHLKNQEGGMLSKLQGLFGSKVGKASKAGKFKNNKNLTKGFGAKTFGTNRMTLDAKKAAMKSRSSTLMLKQAKYQKLLTQRKALENMTKQQRAVIKKLPKNDPMRKRYIAVMKANKKKLTQRSETIGKQLTKQHSKLAQKHLKARVGKFNKMSAKNIKKANLSDRELAYIKDNVKNKKMKDKILRYEANKEYRKIVSAHGSKGKLGLGKKRIRAGDIKHLTPAQQQILRDRGARQTLKRKWLPGKGFGKKTAVAKHHGMQTSLKAENARIAKLEGVEQTKEQAAKILGQKDYTKKVIQTANVPRPPPKQGWSLRKKKKIAPASVPTNAPSMPPPPPPPMPPAPPATAVKSVPSTSSLVSAKGNLGASSQKHFSTLTGKGTKTGLMFG